MLRSLALLLPLTALAAAEPLLDWDRARLEAADEDGTGRWSLDLPPGWYRVETGLRPGTANPTVASALGGLRARPAGAATTAVQYAAVTPTAGLVVTGPVEHLAVTHLPLARPARQDRAVEPEPSLALPAAINPPTFRWPARDGARAYELAWAPAGTPWEQAARVRLERDGGDAPRPFHRPAAALAPGPWRWRLAVDGRWLDEVPFAVDPASPRWDLPEGPAAARFRRDHPRILVDRDDLERIRARCLGGGRLGAYAGRVVADLEARRGEALDLDGLDGPGADKYSDRWFASLRRVAVTARPVPELLVLGRALGRDDLVAEGLRRAERLAALDPAGASGHQADDFANGAVLQALAFACDLGGTGLGPERRAVLRRAILARLAATAYPRRLPRALFDAHAWQHALHDASLAAMAIWDEEPAAARFAEDALRLYTAFYPWFGGIDGGSAEGPHYGLETDAIPALAIRQSWLRFAGTDLADHPWLPRAARWTMAAYPGGAKASWQADGSPDPRAGLGDPAPLFAALSAAVWPDPLAAAYAARHLRLEDADLAKLARGHLLRLMPLVLGLPGEGDAEVLPPAAACFPATGTVHVAQDHRAPGGGLALEFRSSPFAAIGHAHADQNAFNLAVDGRPLVVDAGYYVKWHDAHHFGYAIRTRAHNTLVVDGHEQPPFSALGPGRIAAFASAGRCTWMAGEAASAYPDAGLAGNRRSLLWIGGPGSAVLVVEDRVAAEDGREPVLDWLLHLAAEPRPAADGRGLVAEAAGTALRLDWLADAPPDLRIWSGSDPEPVFGAFRAEQFRDLPPQWHLAARPRAGHGGRILAVLQVDRHRPATALPVPALAGDGLRVGVLAVRRTGGRVQVAEDGRPLADLPEEGIHAGP